MITEKNLCIIPARAGSQRVLRKNIRLLNGKPLIAYTIEAALASHCFADVVVSTDDKEISTISQDYGAQIDLRPKNLGLSNIKVTEVISEFLSRPEHMNEWSNIVMCLPTCPFRTAEDICNAMEIFAEYSHDCPRLMGVTRSIFPPQLVFNRIEGSDNPLFDMREPEQFSSSTRSQDFQILYKQNGSIFITTVVAFLKSRKFYGRPMLSYVMPAERSLDIDYPFQLAMADLWAGYLQNCNKE